MCLRVKSIALPQSGDQMVLLCKTHCVAPRFETTPLEPSLLKLTWPEAMDFLACMSNCPSCLQLAAPDCSVTSSVKLFSTLLLLYQLLLTPQGFKAQLSCPFFGKSSPTANLPGPFQFSAAAYLCKTLYFNYSVYS